MINKLELKERLILSLIFIIIFSLLVFDVIEDLSSGASMSHVAFEAMILLLAMLGVLIQWTVYFFHKKRIEGLSGRLSNVRSDLLKFKSESKKYSEGLAKEIDLQLDRWGLSRAEKEITLLVLKGLSNKEVANTRQTSEKTVRQQMSAIFYKTGLTTRSEILAFFLEDLLVILERKGS